MTNCDQCVTLLSQSVPVILKWINPNTRFNICFNQSLFILKQKHPYTKNGNIRVFIFNRIHYVPIYEILWSNYVHVCSTNGLCISCIPYLSWSCNLHFCNGMRDAYEFLSKIGKYPLPSYRTEFFGRFSFLDRCVGIPAFSLFFFWCFEFVFTSGTTTLSICGGCFTDDFSNDCGSWTTNSTVVDEETFLKARTRKKSLIFAKRRQRFKNTIPKIVDRNLVRNLAILAM